MTRGVEWSRDVLDGLRAQIAFIAAENPAAAQRVADRLRATDDALGKIPTGRPGRVAGTYEKSVTGLRYIIAYALTRFGDREIVSILRVIYTARDWPDEEWPRVGHSGFGVGTALAHLRPRCLCHPARSYSPMLR